MRAGNEEGGGIIRSRRDQEGETCIPPGSTKALLIPEAIPHQDPVAALLVKIGPDDHVREEQR